jgi:hypothetical protein
MATGTNDVLAEELGSADDTIVMGSTDNGPRASR